MAQAVPLAAAGLRQAGPRRSLPRMVRSRFMKEDQLHPSGQDARSRRWVTGLILAGVAVGAPALAHFWIRRRARPPQAPRWGRAHRFAGRRGPVAFQELGEGVPVVLLHSFGPGHDSHEWRAAAEALAVRHRIYVLDLPGWGRSELSSERAAKLAAGHYVEIVEEFLIGVVRHPAAVVASGLAAAYATLVAARRPELVRGLALVVPLGLGPDPAASALDLARQLFTAKLLRVPLLRASVLDLLTSHELLGHQLRGTTYASPERVDAALLDHHYRASHLPRTRMALAAYWRGDLDPSPREVALALSHLHCPVWIGWGRDSVSPPVASADLWLRHVPDAELDLFATSGSLPHAEVPAAFSLTLGRFLAGLPDS
ncbi:MAG: alpha/beta hydrolase [Acidobacteriota bacterium]|nr:alpha/beta hydrolase [Acidobacteriota bacterium]